MLTDSPQNEFWYHVSNQNEIPIAGNAKKKILDFSKLESIIDKCRKDSGNIPNVIKKLVINNPNSLDILRTLVGISDKRMYLELSYIFSRHLKENENEINILGDTVYNINKHPLDYFKKLIKTHAKHNKNIPAKIITDYLTERNLEKVLSAMIELDDIYLKILVEKWISTKEIQQAEAKRRGHGAELELAKLLAKFGCKFIPENRHLIDIGKDPNVDKIRFEISSKKKGHTWSFDLIILDPRNTFEPLIYLQSLIHTSDPGQYGVNKSDETISIKKDLEVRNKKFGNKKELWGLVDGVGFCENKKDTIDKMLDHFDCFIQLKSLYKAPLRLHRIGILKIKGIRFDDKFYNKSQMNSMYQKYCEPNGVKLFQKTKTGKGLTEIPAGKAWLYF